MRNLRIGVGAVAALFLCFLAYEAFQWGICRVYVPEGSSLQLRWKGPLIFRVGLKYAKAGHFAEKGEVGVLRDLRGPGRHFYNPIYYERNIVPDVVIEPGNVGICTSKLGNELPKGEFLVDGDLDTAEHKGILRKCFGPGRYRAHPYAYEFKIIQEQQDAVGREGATQIKHSGWVNIPAGYVGVVTYLTADKTSNILPGTHDDVLPPGLYPINPREAQVDSVEIGYTDTSIIADVVHDENGKIQKDESGEALPVPGTGINFPSDDGRKIVMDFTSIWGVMPDQAPDVVRTFGNVDAVEQKVIIPQSESISRNNGSKLEATELLEGITRTAFQEQTTKEFKLVLEGGSMTKVLKKKQEDGTIKEISEEIEVPGKNLTLLYALVRHIYIPKDIREPIQKGYVAEELKLTRKVEGDTAKIEADLREAEQQVKLESDKVTEDTKKLVAEKKREGKILDIFWLNVLPFGASEEIKAVAYLDVESHAEAWEILSNYPGYETQ